MTTASSTPWRLQRGEEKAPGVACRQRSQRRSCATQRLKRIQGSAHLLRAHALLEEDFLDNVAIAMVRVVAVVPAALLDDHRAAAAAHHFHNLHWRRVRRRHEAQEQHDVAARVAVSAEERDAALLRPAAEDFEERNPAGHSQWR